MRYMDEYLPDGCGKFVGDEVWAAYEEEKARWKQSHPGASSQDYERAVVEIAERLGL